MWGARDYGCLCGLTVSHGVASPQLLDTLLEPSRLDALDARRVKQRPLRRAALPFRMPGGRAPVRALALEPHAAHQAHAPLALGALLGGSRCSTAFEDV